MSQFHGSIDEGLALVISPESYRWLKVSTEFTNYCFCRTFIADILHTHHPLLSQNSLITLSSYNISIFTVSLINKWFYTIFHAWECLVLLTDTTRSLSQLVKHFYAEFSAVYNDIKMHRLLMANWIKCNLLFQVFFGRLNDFRANLDYTNYSWRFVTSRSTFQNLVGQKCICILLKSMANIT